MSTSGSPRVLMVAQRCHPTEIAQMAGLRARGVELSAIVAPASPYLDSIRAHGIPVETLALRNHFDLKAVRHLRRRIRSEGFEIVHGLANRPVSNLFWASLGQPVRLVAYRGAIGHVNRWDPGAWLKWYNPRIDRIICVSEAVRLDLIRSGVKPERVATIYKGHELGWYENRKEVDRSEFGIPPDAFVVGCIASMRPIKGVDVLVRAMAGLDPGTNVHCLLIGDVRDDRIPNLIDQLGVSERIHIAGHRDDAIDVIGGCDVVVAPSRGREGLTKAVIEGMAQGLPAIVSNAGGLPEMVEEGDTGFIVPVEDYRALAFRISCLANDRNRAVQMGERARSLVAERFSVDETVTKTSELYTSLRSSA